MGDAEESADEVDIPQRLDSDFMMLRTGIVAL